MFSLLAVEVFKFMPANCAIPPRAEPPDCDGEVPESTLTNIASDSIPLEALKKLMRKLSLKRGQYLLIEIFSCINSKRSGINH